MEHGLRPPKCKRRAPSEKPIPFPVPFASISGLPASNARWACYHGHLHNKMVVVKNTEHAGEIYNKGFFGHWVNLDDSSKDMPTSPSIDDLPHLKTEKPTCQVEAEVIVLSGSDDEKETSKACDVADAENQMEWMLCLVLEEAFFLLYALGCLVVYNDEKKLNAVEMWQLCCEMEPSFVIRYAGYHYFRSKGWVVRHESAFGCDYLLYKYGPPYYHASYSVLLQVGRSKCFDAEQLKSIQKMTWLNLNALNRITEHVGKELLIAYVSLPNGIASEEHKLPSVIKKCIVREMLFHRWIPSQEREGQKRK